MFRWAWALLLAASVYGQDELQRAAKNPHDLVGYLNAHGSVDWRLVWKTNGLPESDAPYCGTDRTCTVDLITIAPPAQVILAIEGPPEDTYLRFLSDGAEWRCAGSFGAFKKNYGGRYEVIRQG